MTESIMGDDLRAWQNWLIGRPCPKHPQNRVKDGKYGIWCGAKTELGTWCDCGMPSKKDLELMKHEYEQGK